MSSSSALLHSNMVEIYRQRISALIYRRTVERVAEALRQPRERGETAGAVRALVLS